MQHWLTKHEKHVLFLVALTGLLALVFWYHREQVLVSREATVRSRIGIDLLAGAVKGRQGLVGSLKWEPLPTLLLLPVVKVPALGDSGLGAAVVNAVIAAFTLTLLNAWWRRFGIPRPVRFPLLIFYQMSPPVLAAVLTGSSATMMLLILMAGAYFLVNWLVTLDVRSLAYLGVLGGLAIVTLYLSVVLVAVMAVFITVRVWRMRERSFRSATLLIYLIPSIYTAGLWFTANWLIMGNALYFLRGVSKRARLAAELRGIDLDWYLYLMPVLLLVAAVTLRRVRGTVRRAALVPAVVLVILAAVAWPYLSEYTLTERHRSYFGRSETQLARVDEVLTYIEHYHPDAKVFVCGYTGYQFIARSADPERFVHLMSVDLHRIDRETRGQDLFFLIPKPEGVYRWEDINLTDPRLFDEYIVTRLQSGELKIDFMLWPPGEEWDNWHLIKAIRQEPATDRNRDDASIFDDMSEF